MIIEFKLTGFFRMFLAHSTRLIICFQLFYFISYRFKMLQLMHRFYHIFRNTQSIFVQITKPLHKSVDKFIRPIQIQLIYMYVKLNFEKPKQETVIGSIKKYNEIKIQKQIIVIQENRSCILLYLLKYKENFNDCFILLLIQFNRRIMYNKILGWGFVFKYYSFQWI